MYFISKQPPHLPKLRQSFSSVGTLICATLICAAPASANDTNAVIGLGGIQFTKTNDLKMEREYLFLSTTEVRVAYIFRNLTDHDITTTVAFPIPDLDMGTLSEAPHQFHANGREGDIVDFHVRVNGAEIDPSITVQAINPEGLDVTALLHSHKIPVTDAHADPSLFTDWEVWQAIEALNPEEVKDLEAAHAIYEDGEHPRWIARTAYHWQQTFPAKATIKVEHWYKPVVGGGPLSTNPQWTRSDMSQWCPDETFLKALHKLDPVDGAYVRGDWMEYVLKTGANWAGPIGHFRLELDKGNATLLSTCPIPGLSLKKTGNRFVAEADNFTPATDLKILFVRKND